MQFMSGNPLLLDVFKDLSVLTLHLKGPDYPKHVMT